MVAHTIPTSAWSHNCGMHVIADFLIEKLQKEKYRECFSGKSYEKLLESFQSCYQQKELTWKIIREATEESTREDAQIIFGFVLRQMLPEILRENIDYKKNLATEFIAAFKLFKNNSEKEAIETYPIILIGNIDYIESQLAALSDETLLQYWDQKGYNNYCEAVTIKDCEVDGYLWLGEAEISYCSRYFGIESVVIHDCAKTEYNEEKIFLTNPTNDHWQRYVQITEDKNVADTKVVSSFYKIMLSSGLSLFVKNANLIGAVYFQGLYQNPDLGIKWAKEINIFNLGKYFVKDDKQGFVEYIKKNKLSSKQFGQCIELIAANFDFELLKSWIENAEIKKQFIIPYDQLLVGATHSRYKNNFEQLLSNFPEIYTAKNCMPALIESLKNDRFELSNILLSLPVFNIKENTFQKVATYIASGYFYILNQFDKDGVPAVYYAIQRNNLELTEKLLSKGACATYNVKGKNAFQWALETNNPKMVVLLSDTLPPKNLKDGIYDRARGIIALDVNFYNSKGDNAFHICVKNADLNSLKELERRMGDGFSNNRENKSCLHLASEVGQVDIIKYLLNKNFSVCRLENNNDTVFHLAAKNRHLEALKELCKALDQEMPDISNRIKFLNKKNKNGKSALHLAHDSRDNTIIDFFKLQGYVEAIIDTYEKLFLETQKFQPDYDELFKTNLDILKLSGCKNYTLLHRICFLMKSSDSQKIIKVMVKYGANTEALTDDGLTPLHIAVINNNLFAIRALLNEGAFINAMTYKGLTPAHYAVLADNKKIFCKLKNYCADLNLAAFPSSTELFSPHIQWKSDEPITALALARKMDGDIQKYLDPSRTTLSVKIRFHSIEHRLFYGLESLAKCSNHYVSNVLWKELPELEATSTYQWCSFGRAVAYAGLASMFGPYVAATEIVKQGILHLTPSINKAGNELYYHLKPGIHNANYRYTSTGFDFLSSGLSYTYCGIFKMMNYYNMYQNFGLRFTEGVVGVVGLKAAQHLGVEDREKQAGILFLSKLVGEGLYAGYRESHPVQKAYKAYHLDPSLNQAYEVWTAILGKENGEKYVNFYQCIIDTKVAVFTYIGEAERPYLEKITGYLNFKKVFDSFGDNLVANMISPYVSPPIEMAAQGAQETLNRLAEYRDCFLIGLEEIIHQNIVIDSEYRDVILRYVYKQKEILSLNLKQEVELKLRKAIEAEDEENIRSYEGKIKVYNQEIETSIKNSNDFFEKTPKGKIANQFYATQKANAEAWYDVQHLKTLKVINPAELVEQAYQALGKELTKESLCLYLQELTNVNTQNYGLNTEALEAFELSLKATPIEDITFKDKLTSSFSDFFQKQVNFYIEEQQLILDDILVKSNKKLEDVFEQFMPLASPEELRAFEESKNTLARMYLYNVKMIENNAQINEIAIRKTKYISFIESDNECKKIEFELLLIEAELKVFEFDKEVELASTKVKDNLQETEVSELIDLYDQEIIASNAERAEKLKELSLKRESLELERNKVLSKLTPIEKYQFNKYVLDLKSNADFSAQLNQHLLDKAIVDYKYESKMAEKENILKLIEKNEAALKQLDLFSLDYLETYTRVSKVYDSTNILSDAKENILKSYVSELPFDYDFLSKKTNIRAPVSIIGKGSGNDKKDEAKSIIREFKKFKEEYFPSKINALNESLNFLKSQLSALDADLSSYENQRLDLVEKINKAESQANLSSLSKGGFSFGKTFKNVTAESEVIFYIDDLPKYLDAEINSAFETFSERHLLAENLADITIKYQTLYNKYNNMGKKIPVKDRDTLIHEISTYKLSGYQKSEGKAKNRSYNYIYATITGTKEKHHHPRWKRILMPLINEFTAELTGGYIPYKNFSGGEDKKGTLGFQLGWKTDGRFNVNLHINDEPVLKLYESKPTEIPPEFLSSKLISKKPMKDQATVLDKHILNNTQDASNNQENVPAVVAELVLPVQAAPVHEQPSILNGFKSHEGQTSLLQLISPTTYAITHPESQPAIGTGISQQPFSCIVTPAVPPVKQPAVPSGSKVEPNKPKSGPTKAPNSSKKPKPAEGNAKQKVTISKKPSKNTLPAPAPKPVVFRDKTSTAAASDAQSGWSKTHQVIVTGQPQPGNQLTPQMPTDPKILQAWEKIRPELEKPGLTASRVGEIFFEAAEEFAIETMEGVKALAEFSAKEKHFGTIVGGVQTAQIGIMCGKFVGDEAMRIVAHEKLESMKVVEEWCDSLINLSGEELIKEGLKFGFGCTPVLAPLKGVKIAGELSKAALKAVSIAEKGKSVEEVGLLGITKLNKATETSHQSVLKTTPAYDLHRKLSSESLNSLAKPVDQDLINQLNKKGWIIDIAKPGTDNWRWLEYNGADASFNTGVPKHILLKEGAPRSALLEEFLHGTQNDLNLIEKYGTFQNLEIHVKDFMLRHVNLLGLNNPHDIRLLQQLKIEEVDRLRNMKI